jgi:hypothetical protein
MKGEHEEAAIGASLSDDAHAENTTRPVPEGDAADSRMGRIMEYLQASLDREDALQASLNAANADLMVIGYKLAAVIKATMAATPPSLEAYEELIPAIGNLLRIHKQVDRFSALDSRLAMAKAAVASLKVQASTAIERSEDVKN